MQKLLRIVIGEEEEEREGEMEGTKPGVTGFASRRRIGANRFISRNQFLLLSSLMNWKIQRRPVRIENRKRESPPDISVSFEENKRKYKTFLRIYISMASVVDVLLRSCRKVSKTFVS